MIRFDVPFIFETLGGPSGVHKALLAAFPGVELKYTTVQMWSQRGIISQPWQAPILYVMLTVAGVQPLVCMTDDNDLAA